MRVQCNAKWVLDQQWASYKAKQDSQRLSGRVGGAPTARAKYCRGPFFTWTGSGGDHGTHVGVHTGLYLDLLVLIKSLESSMAVVDTQLERIRSYNGTRVQSGRFLFGHSAVDEARGGIFIVDASLAQPHSAADFVVHQLAQMLDFWCAAAPSYVCDLWCSSAE